MESRYDSYCGIYCGACDTLAANENGKLWKLARDWNRSPEDLRCHGCKSDVRSIYCANCAMRACAVEKDVEFCFECGEYPCEKLASFRADECPHHTVVIENLETIRNVGVDMWLEAQAERWKCPSCGTRFTWYDKRCKQCDAELYNCEAEEKNLAAK